MNNYKNCIMHLKSSFKDLNKWRKNTSSFWSGVYRRLKRSETDSCFPEAPDWLFSEWTASQLLHTTLTLSAAQARAQLRSSGVCLRRTHYRYVLALAWSSGYFARHLAEGRQRKEWKDEKWNAHGSYWKLKWISLPDSLTASKKA